VSDEVPEDDPPTIVPPETPQLGPEPVGVRMELSRIIISELQDQQVIVLHEVDGPRQFPIVIGSPEALAIDRRLKGIVAARPLTHDLLATVVEAMGGTVDRIEIHNLQDHTFFARVVIRRRRRTKADANGNGASAGIDDWVEVDSRPSDAIAVGVATNVPVYVSDQVLDEVS
jgi:bifunctional DNase/RNase